MNLLGLQMRVESGEFSLDQRQLDLVVKHPDEEYTANVTDIRLGTDDEGDAVLVLTVEWS